MKTISIQSTSGDPSTISSGLLADVCRRDSGAWQRFVGLYGPLVYRWCRESGLQRHAAEDVVQDVFCSILSGITKFRRRTKDDTFRGWLRTVTNNKIHDAARKRSRQPVVPGQIEASRLESTDLLVTNDEPPSSSSASSSSAQPSVVGDAALLDRALKSIRGDFNATTWEAFHRSTVLGHTASEIGADLKMTPKAVRQAKYRVMVRLRAALDPEL